MPAPRRDRPAPDRNRRDGPPPRDGRPTREPRPHRGGPGHEIRPAPGYAQKTDRPRLPLSPDHLVQRPLALEEGASLPVVEIKSPTGAPTVFRKRVEDVDRRAHPGDLVELKLPGGVRFGEGLLNQRAEAMVRILTRGDQRADEEWWSRQLLAAAEFRRDFLGLDRTTSAWRVVHAEGDGLPGLVIDRYGPVLSLEVFSLGMYQRAGAIAETLSHLMEIPHWIVRPAPRTLDHEGFEADSFSSPDLPRNVTITEHGTKYEIDLVDGHKTGFFCDQRDNRQLLTTMTGGKTVLDLCCYTGGFSVAAKTRGGAAETTGVDLDEVAVEQAKRNARINQSQIKYVHTDAFRYIRDMQQNGTKYDVVVLDPPKLLHSREEESLGKRKYFDMNKLAMELVAPGGMLLTCSCSGLLNEEDFRKLVIAAVPDDRRAQILHQSGAGPDHPVATNCLETSYLKTIWMRFPE
jgi:23S rRNA (cytosine1962-C5)-methyltransferase